MKGNNIIAVLGFGSFFRSSDAEDVDLLIVLDDHTPDPGARYVELHRIFGELGNTNGVTFDLTVLLESELNQKLLVEHDSLVEIVLLDGRIAG